MEHILEKSQTSIQLFSLNGNNEISEETGLISYQPNLDDQLISLQEIESISGCSYAYLISESYKANKGFIIARTKTRSNQDHTKKFYHYFYAANLI